MALPYPIAPSQTDAKSPVDDNLMDSIRLDLEYLESIATTGGVPSYVWNVNGRLRLLTAGVAKRLDTQFLHVNQVFTNLRIAQRVGGTGGKTEIDIRYHSNPKTPIISITDQFSSNTTSIAQVAPAIATQTIAKATPQVATQSITRAKGTLNILSIHNVGTNLWKYNLSAMPDNDYRVGDSVLTAGATTGANNGTFTIVEVNQSGFPSIVITNAAGVAQAGAAGTLELQCFSYNLVNPATASFVAGEPVVLAAHTNANNNGSKTIYDVNRSGNNIWVKNPTGVVQASTPGTIDSSRWVYTYSAPAPASFVVGEIGRFASHTTGANNGNFPIVAVNSGGNNIVVTNTAGVAQGAAAGNANTSRWKYSFGVDPSTQVAVGDDVLMASHTNANNNGLFRVVALNDLTANNIVVYNVNGVAQASTPGTVRSTRKLVNFSSDQSLIYSTDSYVELVNTDSAEYNMSDSILPFKVLEVNRGGGASYNIVIKANNGPVQTLPRGYVAIEARSIFTANDGSKPQLTPDMLGLSPNGLLKAHYTGSELKNTPVPAQTYMGLYILSIQDGEPYDLSVMLT